MSQAHALPARIEPVSFTAFTSDFDSFAETLGASFARYGFAVISDHGLTQARIDAALDAAKRFFALSEADHNSRLHIFGKAGLFCVTEHG